MNSNQKYVCKECGTVALNVESGYYGSFANEIGLWILTIIGFGMFVIPGLILAFFAFRYSIQRYTQKGTVCRACGARKSMIPADTPQGKMLSQR